MNHREQRRASDNRTEHRKELQLPQRGGRVRGVPRLQGHMAEVLPVDLTQGLRLHAGRSRGHHQRAPGHHLRQDSDRPTWIKPETLGEFTGLYDSHGTEIYEGDIVKTDYHVEKVVYEEGEWRLYISNNSYSILSNHIGNGYYIEVIGNIHDNLELLNGEI